MANRAVSFAICLFTCVAAQAQSTAITAMKPTLLLLALCARTLAQAHSLMQKLKKSLLMALVALPPIGFAHAAADPTLFVFTTQPDGGGWKASTYDAVTGVLLNGGFPLSSMPAALGNTLFEINGNFTIGKYNLSDGSLIKAVFITLPSNRGVAWALTAGGNNLYVTTDLGIVEQYNATTGALINADFITKVNSNDTGGIMWPAIPSTGIFSPTPNGSSGEYGPLIASGNNLYAAQAGPFWKVYNITTGALISTGLGPYWFGDAFAIIGNNAYEMFNGGGVTELNASYGNVINNSFIIPPTTTSESGIAASGNYLFVANGNAGTVAEYTADGILVNPTFITDAGDYPNTPVVALFVAPAAMSR